jgi:Uma2 family endonuclease
VTTTARFLSRQIRGFRYNSGMDSILEPILKSPRFSQHVDDLLRARTIEQAARERFYDELSPDEKAEFIHGEKIVHSPVKLEHNRATMLIAFTLDRYVEAKRLGMVGIEKLLIALARNDYEPDVAYWHRDKSASFSAQQMKFPAPDLVVEVLSDSTEERDRGIKFTDYADAGIGEYWLVDPATHVVEQFLLDGPAYKLAMKSSTGQLVSRAVAGFSIAIPALFDREQNAVELARLLAP